jgi:hypothetical protein
MTLSWPSFKESLITDYTQPVGQGASGFCGRSNHPQIMIVNISFLFLHITKQKYKRLREGFV